MLGGAVTGRVMMRTSCPFKADSRKAWEVISPFWTRTKGGKVALESARERAVMVKREVERREVRIEEPTRPVPWKGCPGRGE